MESKEYTGTSPGGVKEKDVVSQHNATYSVLKGESPMPSKDTSEEFHLRAEAAGAANDDSGILCFLMVVLFQGSKLASASAQRLR